MQPAIAAFCPHRFEAMDCRIEKTGRLSFLYAEQIDAEGRATLTERRSATPFTVHHVCSDARAVVA